MPEQNVPPAQKTEQLPKEMAQVKAGVEGNLDVPAPPSPTPVPSGQAPGVGSFEEDAPLPRTTGGFSQDVQTPSTEQAGFGEQPVKLDWGPASVPQSAFDEDRIHEITESVVNERWEDLMSSLGNIPIWKEKTSNDIVAMKQEILRISNRFDNLQVAVLGQVKEYDKSVRDIHSEMKALEKVFERIMEPLVVNVKELNKIVEEMKRLWK